MRVAERTTVLGGSGLHGFTLGQSGNGRREGMREQHVEAVQAGAPATSQMVDCMNDGAEKMRPAVGNHFHGARLADGRVLARRGIGAKRNGRAFLRRLQQRKGLCRILDGIGTAPQRAADRCRFDPG